ncbi:class I adenylate-forming enzyme family protein [Nocardia sp. CA-107356]|uniref:class I adenylate-forming enzyme family protein n=1 Tax=Nocardia sp. CA-107356 TaxID=3239972 RepID=UPI003D946D54
MDLTTIARKGASQFAESPAVICDGHIQTYEQLFERACRLANALAALGVQPGERVATLSDNGPEAVEQMVGIALGGYVRTALYTHNSGQSNRYLLDLVEASALIVEAKRYEEIAAQLPGSCVRHVIVFGGEVPDGTLGYEQALAASSADDPGIALRPDDPHLIRFSAGTTGKPKGILHNVAGWSAVATEMTLVMPRMDQTDRYLAAGSLSHAALLPLFGTLAAGGAVVVMRAFHPARFLSLLAQERCTTTLLVPTMIQMIAGDPAARTTDVSSLRAVFYGAAPISERTLGEARALWGDIMYQWYGQSEVVPLTVLAPADHIGGRLRSAGRPTPHTILRIVDANGDDVGPGEIGEIAARTPAAMTAIWRDPAATAERLLPDGSVLTRDMGYLDEDGFLYLADRKEDMIISGGFNIWPAELENALASHPAVAQVAVVGVPHEKWGETPKAVVVLRSGREASEEDLIAWTREKVGAVKRVTSVEFADDLPKSALGKILRREVRARYQEPVGRNVAGT